MESTHLEVCVVEDVLAAGHDHGVVVAVVLGEGDSTLATNPSPISVIAVCGRSADLADHRDFGLGSEDEGLDDVRDDEVGPSGAGRDVAAELAKDEFHLLNGKLGSGKLRVVSKGATERLVGCDEGLVTKANHVSLHGIFHLTP